MKFRGFTLINALEEADGGDGEQEAEDTHFACAEDWRTVSGASVIYAALALCFI
jgi:hypothetical protein